MKTSQKAMDMKTKESGENLPSVSVIVPAFNSEKTIAQTLESLKNMDYPHDKLEVIVVDDASTDETAEVALHRGARIIRREKRGGCAAAKNTGVGHAKKEMVAFIDSDVMVAKNWLRELVKPFEEATVGATGGFVKIRFRKASSLGKYDNLDKHFRKRKADTKSVPGSNSAYRREVFEVVGRLDPYLGEDPDFCYRVQSHGYKVIYNDKAVVYHPAPNDFWTYFKKQVYYGWQRTLIFLLYPQLRSTLIADEHTPLAILLQPFISTAMILSLLLAPMFNSFMIICLALFLLLITLNVPFLRFIYTKDARLVLFAFSLSVLRSIAFAIGLAMGVISFLKVKITRMR